MDPMLNQFSSMVVVDVREMELLRFLGTNINLSATWKLLLFSIDFLQAQQMAGWWFQTCLFSIIYGIILPID